MSPSLSTRTSAPLRLPPALSPTWNFVPGEGVCVLGGGGSVLPSQGLLVLDSSYFSAFFICCGWIWNQFPNTNMLQTGVKETPSRPR